MDTYVCSREAGAVLGLRRLPSRPKIWEWFYSAAELKLPLVMLGDYFRHQL